MKNPSIGIDYGTGTSSMAWFNANTGRAEVINNAEGKPTTPSLVFFGEDEILVGDAVDVRLSDPEDRWKVFPTRAKRDLGNSVPIMLGGKKVTAKDAAVAVLRKLKRDAEFGHFGGTNIAKAVITVPATFSEAEKGFMHKAGIKAGFDEIELLDEPTAAAIAFAHNGLQVGKTILVYDLGAGTFDLSILSYEEDSGVFEPIMPPRGVPKGGDKFDDVLYEYVENVALREEKTVALDGRRNLQLLRECRLCKELLSTSREVTLNLFLPEGKPLRVKLNQEHFEQLIEPIVAETIQQTISMIADAKTTHGVLVDTLVLIGGSSRVPLIARELESKLDIKPQPWQSRDVAVALGAAYRAEQLWGDSGPRKAYRKWVEIVRRESRFTPETLEESTRRASALTLTSEAAHQIEVEVLGTPLSDILQQQTAKAEGRYRLGLARYRESLQSLKARDDVTPDDLERVSEILKQYPVTVEDIRTIDTEVLSESLGQFIDRINQSRRQKAEAFLREAEACIKKNERHLAFRKCQAAQDADPTWVNPYLAKGLISYHEKNFSAVDVTVTAGMRYNPKATSLFLLRAAAAVKLNLWKKAIDDCDFLEARDAEETPDWLVLRAIAQWMTKKREEAIRDLRLAVTKLDPEGPASEWGIKVSLAMALQQTNQFADALELHREAYAIWRSNPSSLKGGIEPSWLQVNQLIGDLEIAEYFGMPKGAEVSQIMQQKIWECCTGFVEGSDMRAQVAEFYKAVPSSANPSSVFAGIRNLPDFGLWMTSLLAEKLEAAAAKSWLEDEFAKKPSLTNEKYDTDPYIREFSPLQGLLQPKCTISYKCASPVNTLWITNASLFTVKNIKLTVRYRHSKEGSQKNRFEIGSLAPKQVGPWTPVFSNPGFFGGNIADIEVSATSDQGALEIQPIK